jgi:hypothetical protein
MHPGTAGTAMISISIPLIDCLMTASIEVCKDVPLVAALGQVRLALFLR